MENMLELILENFSINNIDVSEDTMKVIEDLLNDFDFREISYYTEKEKFDFKDKLILKNNITMDINGYSEGKSQWTATYLGESLSGLRELIVLENGGLLMNTLVENNYDPEVDFESDNVIIIETVEWNSKNNKSKEPIYTSSKELILYLKQENEKNVE